MTPGLALDSGEFIPASELNRRIEMKHAHWMTEILTGATGTFQRSAREYAEEYAQQAIEPLQKRIAELEAQTTQLAESLETASAACIMLKQQQREGWAQLASGQEPIAWFDEEMQSAYTRAELNGGAIEGLIPLYTRPSPEQQPLSDGQIAEVIQKKHFSKGYVLHSSDKVCLDWYRLGIKDCEAAHNIKEKP